VHAAERERAIARIASVASAAAPGDQLLALLVFREGVTPAEALRLDVSSLRRDPPAVLVEGKTGALRTVVLDEAAAAAAFELVGGRVGGPLFFDETGERMDRAEARQRLVSIAAAAGVGLTSIHALRRELVLERSERAALVSEENRLA
jgi:site-specific recombinase XerD